MAQTIASRLRLLIDQYHAGSVNDAARAMRLPQRTLADIVSGTVENPRTASLKKLATHFNVTLDWLLTGADPQPDFIAPLMRDAMPEFRELGETIGPLKLSQPVQQALTELPWAPVWAFRFLVQERHAEKGYRTLEAAVNAAALQARCWTELIQAMVKEIGPRAVAEEFERNVDAIRLGFGGFAYWRALRDGKGAPKTRASEWAEFEEFRAQMLKGP